MRVFLVFLAIFSLCYGDFSVKNLIKTNKEIKIEEYLSDIDSLLVKFYEKLNRRNPNSFNKKNENIIKSSLREGRYIFVSGYEREPIALIKKALDKEKKISFRNDYLIIGIHDMIYKVFKRDDFKVTALSYHLEKLNRLFLNIQIIFWQINTYKDREGNYLFLTWQNDWQVKLLKALREGDDFKKALLNLKQDELLKPCNMSFSMIYSNILYIIEKIIKERGGEPREIGVNVLKSLALSPFL